MPKHLYLKHLLPKKPNKKCVTRIFEPSHILLVALFMLTLYGCATSTGVQSHGNNRYRVEGASEFGLASARDRAMEDAAAFCGSPQRVNQISTRNDFHFDLFGDRIQTWELIFQCGSSSNDTYKTAEEIPLQNESEPRDYQRERQDQALTKAYDRCTSDGLNDHAIIQACSETIKLDPRGSLLEPEARTDVLYNRSLAYARLQYYDEAIADMQGVLEIAPQDREAFNLLADLRADQEELNRQIQSANHSTLVFNGFWCPKVQKDSVLYPANELIINIVVSEQNNQIRETTLPGRGKSYNNIKKGTARRTGGIILWEGQRQPLIVQATMWEYDDGGPLIDQLTAVAVDFALTRGTKTMAKYAVKQGTSRAIAQGSARATNQAFDSINLTNQLSRHISSLPKNLLGTNNDLVGSIGIANVSADLFNRPDKEQGFSYNFRTKFTRGGADCRMYFEFK